MPEPYLEHRLGIREESIYLVHHISAAGVDGVDQRLAAAVEGAPLAVAVADEERHRVDDHRRVYRWHDQPPGLVHHTLAAAAVHYGQSLVGEAVHVPAVGQRGREAGEAGR